ncbi:hydrogen peroxide-inducible genes activator [Aureibacter tunicatorum]|uniref:LysR family hydrogen peroxide-inducible transcriptional activator n=1 Tax=Aureibacter tunicatorum TaxID=866807 RepID=A0AAE4BRA4_9BACT|nr:LysR substrate-binding domain-containing protein [Aureibacter tunicatorum]MDR6237565.1 LysR family hydrogen peroxide-inducible transcriptional activator [Aureibacter tunicatorum]BDD02599.1 transcriptional regulator [Aureibacter tunicatorum]
MTLQQLEYIIAVKQFGHFVEAARHCGVTQPTLSQMILKLENELEVTIFDRKKHPIVPTAMGEKLIKQAEKALKEVRRMNEIIEGEVDSISGSLRIGVIPTLSTYLIPDFIGSFKRDYPQVELMIKEAHTQNLIKALNDDEVDLFIAATPLDQDNFYEIPLYYEKFVAYFSPDNPNKDIPLSAENMPNQNLWVLQEGHCVRNQIFNFCEAKTVFNQTFEAGSIDTLIKIVEKNGGYSVIPELHLDLMNEEQKNNVREINPPAVREISLVIKSDFIKERMINAVADTIKKHIPEKMLDERLKKFSIKL